MKRAQVQDSLLKTIQRKFARSNEGFVIPVSANKCWTEEANNLVTAGKVKLTDNGYVPVGKYKLSPEDLNVKRTEKKPAKKEKSAKSTKSEKSSKPKKTTKPSAEPEVKQEPVSPAVAENQAEYNIAETVSAPTEPIDDQNQAPSEQPDQSI